jgi:segregation and condensation protein A
MTDPGTASTHSIRYTVRLPLFEGPLDLLLHLIQKNELDITAISLALVADQFVAYLGQLEEVRPGVIADFLVIAARLLLIKSRWLLPKPAQQDEEEEEDPGRDLARRLREYKRFKEAAVWLRELEYQGAHCYVRVAPPPPLEQRLDPDAGSIDDLIAALQEVLAQDAELSPVADVVSPRKVTVREKIELIEHLVRNGEPVSFVHVVGRRASRIDVVVSLWAVLELIKRGRLWAQQSELFGEIVLLEKLPDLQEA